VRLCNGVRWKRELGDGCGSTACYLGVTGCPVVQSLLSSIGQRDRAVRYCGEVVTGRSLEKVATTSPNPSSDALLTDNKDRIPPA
jgi:hypothetical protein